MLDPEQAEFAGMITLRLDRQELGALVPVPHFSA